MRLSRYALHFSLAVPLLLGGTALAQIDPEVLDRDYVITTEDPDVYYDFGEKGWRSEARSYNDWENWQRELDTEQPKPKAAQEQKYLTNVEKGEREPAAEGVEVKYRDIGRDEDDSARTQPRKQPQRTAQGEYTRPDRGRRFVSPERYERGTAPNRLRNRDYPPEREDPRYYNYWDWDEDGYVERVPAGAQPYPDRPLRQRQNRGEDVLERGERRIGGTRGYVERHDNYADENREYPRSPRFNRFRDRDIDWREPRRSPDRETRPERGTPYRVTDEGEVDVDIDVEDDFTPQERPKTYQEAGAGPSVTERPETPAAATARAEEEARKAEKNPSPAQENYENRDFVVEDPANLSAPEPDTEGILNRQQ